LALAFVAGTVALAWNRREAPPLLFPVLLFVTVVVSESVRRPDSTRLRESRGLLIDGTDRGGERRLRTVVLERENPLRR